MYLRTISLIAAAIILLAGCRPKPLDIDVPQTGGTLAISSACIDDHTVYLSAGYSVQSLARILDTTALKDGGGIPREMLVDSAIVTIRAEGALPDTLQMIAPGLFGSRKLRLVPGTRYTLFALDRKKGQTITAVTTYFPRAGIDSLVPELRPGSRDTIVRLQLRLRNATPGSQYFISYNTPEHMRQNGAKLPYSTSALYSFAPKQIELITAKTVGADGIFECAVPVKAAVRDTLFVQLGQIDGAYSDYLAAYKRSGALINQLSGEPINLPTNILKGFGYFSLYEPAIRVIDLRR